jgi:hypothetical protein
MVASALSTAIVSSASTAIGQTPPPAPPPATTTTVAPSPPTATQPPDSPPTPRLDPEQRKTEAKTRFERGLALMKQSAWEAAFQELSRSRDLYPSRGNMQNAAVCLSNLRRFDEALELFQAVLASYPNVTADERAQIEAEITRLRAHVGTIEILILEPGAVVVIDGRVRAVTPLPSTLRLSEGPHVVRIVKEGFVPFEREIGVLGRQNTAVDGRLVPLVRGGRLRVAEQSGFAVDVFVDRVRVGKTPWEGQLSIGEHSVVLRGPSNLGTQPASVPIRENALTPLTLALEPLDAELRVQPVPAGALVALDGVSLGRGIWEGRLHGGQHRLEVAAEGFLPVRRAVTLAPGAREAITIELERDTASPIWRDAKPSRFVVDVFAGAVFAPAVGGDVMGSCSATCNKGLGLGGLLIARGGYELGSGIGFTLDLGYAIVHESVAGRTATLTPVGLQPDVGTADDDLLLHGLVAGASASAHFFQTWPLLVRLGGGVLLGNIRDRRSGKFTTTPSPRIPTREPYDVGPIEETARVSYAHVSPELRLGRRLGAHGELALSLQAMVLFALTQPRWQDEHPVLAGCGPSACEGEAKFGDEALSGKVIVLLSPGIEARVGF